MSVEDIESMLNRRSGMLGLGGEIDFRVMHQRIESGDAAAQLAYDVYIHRLRKYIGAYLALLGSDRRHHLHRGGGGERRGRAPRRAVRAWRRWASSSTSTSTPALPGRARRISADNSPTTVLVVPTNEELAIARACVARDRRTDCGSSSGSTSSGSQIARKRRTCRPADSTHVTPYRAQITLTLCRAAKPAVPKKSISRRSSTRRVDPAIWRST